MRFNIFLLQHSFNNYFNKYLPCLVFSILFYNKFKPISVKISRKKEKRGFTAKMNFQLLCCFSIKKGFDLLTIISFIEICSCYQNTWYFFCKKLTLNQIILNEKFLEKKTVLLVFCLYGNISLNFGFLTVLDKSNSISLTNVAKFRNLLFKAVYWNT